MIQRIQSLYLVAGALLLTLFVGLGETWAGAIAAEQAWLGIAGFVLAGVTAGVALIAVGLFKNRELQRKVIYVAQWLDLALVVAVLVGFYLTVDGADGAFGVTPGYYVVALLPLVAYVLLRMARQRVTKDIDTIRSMDRLR